MIRNYRIEGIDKVQKNLNSAIDGIDRRTLAGVRAAGLFVEGESNEIAPQRTGFLINSSFSNISDTSDGPVAVVGYTAKYAGPVHEAPDTVEWHKPGAENKFLEKAVLRNFSRIINLIAKFAGRG